MHDAMLERAIDAFVDSKPPQELIDRYTSDGGRNLGVATFGWIIAGIYYLLWVTVWYVGVSIAYFVRLLTSSKSITNTL